MTEEATGATMDTTTQHRGGPAPSPGIVLCEVFRSPRHEGMYLYVERSEGPARVPDSLMERFGTPESALVFRLHGERRLARVSATDVLKALAEQGFYLQMPPVPGAGRQDRESDASAKTSSCAEHAGPVAGTRTDREEPSC